MIRRSNVLADVRALFHWACHHLPWCRKHTSLAEETRRRLRESEEERARLASQIIGVQMMVQSRRRAG